MKNIKLLSMAVATMILFSACGTGNESVVTEVQAISMEAMIAAEAKDKIVLNQIKCRETSARMIADRKTAEETQLAEEARSAEETRLAEEARIAEEERLAEEARQAEQARLAEGKATPAKKDNTSTNSANSSTGSNSSPQGKANTASASNTAPAPSPNAPAPAAPSTPEQPAPAPSAPSHTHQWVMDSKEVAYQETENMKISDAQTIPAVYEQLCTCNGCGYQTSSLSEINNHMFDNMHVSYDDGRREVSPEQTIPAQYEDRIVTKYRTESTTRCSGCGAVQ